MKKILSSIIFSILTSIIGPISIFNISKNPILSGEFLNLDNKIKNVKNFNNTNFIETYLNSIPQGASVGGVWSFENNNIFVDTTYGLFKSIDGINFNQINTIKINSLASSYNGTLYGINNANTQLIKSTDGGNTFSQINLPKFEGEYVNISKKDGSIFVGGYYDCFKSTDGINFTQIPNLQSISLFSISSNGNIFASQNGGSLFRSTDGGNTFSEVFKESKGFFIENLSFASNGDIWISTAARGGGLFKSTDGGNTFSQINIPGMDNSDSINTLTIDKNENILISTFSLFNLGKMYISIDNGNTFNFNMKFSPSLEAAENMIISSDGTIYIGAIDHGLWSLNLSNKLINMNKPDYIGNKYTGLVYSHEQKINIWNNYLDTAIFDNKPQILSKTNLELSKGTHTLILTLKKEYWKNANLFGANSITGQINYNFFIKTAIDPINEFGYTIENGNTNLTNKLISNQGNTINTPIIQTESKKGAGNFYKANLDINITSELMDLNNSYYVLGDISKDSGDFTETENKITNLSNKITINNNGIYHFHLVDLLGNKYNSYLELGKENWKIRGNKTEFN